MIGCTWTPKKQNMQLAIQFHPSSPQSSLSLIFFFLFVKFLKILLLVTVAIAIVTQFSCFSGSSQIWGASGAESSQQHNGIDSPCLRGNYAELHHSYHHDKQQQCHYGWCPRRCSNFGQYNPTGLLGEVSCHISVLSPGFLLELAIHPLLQPRYYMVNTLYKYSMKNLSLNCVITIKYDTEYQHLYSLINLICNGYLKVELVIKQAMGLSHFYCIIL